MAVRDNRAKRAKSGVIIGLPVKTDPFYQQFVTPNASGKKRVGTLTNGQIAVSMRLTVSATDAGTCDGRMYVDTVEFYDLTSYNFLCINAIESETDNTGHRWYIELVPASGGDTIRLDQGVKRGITSKVLDISSYKGKYAIRIHIYAGNATYGYAAEYVDVRILSLGLSK